MPGFDIVRRWAPKETFRTQTVRSSFTLEEAKLEKRFQGSLPLENEDWQIGIVVGRSGTGKTTIAKEVFKDAYISKFDYGHESVLDDFPSDLPVSQITKALCSVGFASPPDWLKSYDQLSQGEKMRVDIARALCLERDLIVFDEFTSVVDREIAQISSAAIAKGIRKTKKKFVAVTCHYDVIEWLEPDWIFNTDTMQFIKKSQTVRNYDYRPPLQTRSMANLWAVSLSRHVKPAIRNLLRRTLQRQTSRLHINHLRPFQTQIQPRRKTRRAP